MRLGHISDFHLRHHLEGTSAVAARRSREMPQLVGEAVRLLAAAGVDGVMVTGDLVDHPLGGGDTPAHRRDGLADLRLIADLLAGLPCPWTALPGNHDHPELFAEVFGPPRELEIAAHRVVSFHDWDTDDPTVATPEASAHVPRRRGAERDRFEAVLADADPRAQVHVQHYVITPRLDAGWPHTYADGEDLRDRLAAHGGVRLALSGHYHHGTEARRVRAGSSAGCWFVVAPAFCEAPHPFLVHDLDAAGDLTTTRVDLVTP